MDFIFWLLIISLYKHYFQEDKNKQTYKTGQGLKSKISRPSEVCINYGFVKQKSNYFESIEIFDFVEKNDFLRFLHGDGENMAHKTKIKPYK